MQLHFIKQAWHTLLRFIPQQLCSAACLVVVALLSSPAYAALNTTITNTAGLNYAGLATPLQSAVDVNANVTSLNSGTIVITAPATMPIASSGPVDITIGNTGTNTLATGSVLVVPPANTALVIPVDPLGIYVATLQVDGYTWVVTVPDIASGAATYSFSGILSVLAGAVPANVSIAATYTANVQTIANSIAPIQIQAITRTPAVIAFLHWDAVNSVYIPADVYHAGQIIYVQVTDGDQNIDPLLVETVTISLTDGNSGDTENTIVLTETGPNTGIFIGNIPSIRSVVRADDDGTLSVSAESEIIATYTDLFDLTDTAASAALVDPFGLVFDSKSGAPIDGAIITMMDVATGLPAIVVGDDGVSAYPSTITSGGVETDASGAVYNFSPGNYRFPFMAPGDYFMVVTPPASLSFPSQETTAAIQALASGPFAMTLGSRGETFTVSAGPALHIDLPVDSTSGAGLFIQKTSSTPLVGLGDRVAYNISIENVNSIANASSVLLSDILPLGFRYQADSATLDGIAIPDPTILPNGRNLSFSIGDIIAASTVNLAYTAVVGANASFGPAVNTAFASGIVSAASVQSNTSRATVTVREELIRSRGFIAGTVFIDDDMNDIQDEGELGVAGIRIYMEDGRYVTTDKDGRYHFDGIRPGLHVVQMDELTIAKRYQAVGLKQSRFSNNDFSQFADVRGGGLHRANFRLVNRAPEFTPVLVIHQLTEEEGLVWANVDFEQKGDVPLSELKGFYTLPTGWKYVEGTAILDGVANEPEMTPFGLIWQLDAAQDTQRIRLAMRGGGESGLKEAVAYARFKSTGTEQGRTDLATINIQDTLQELRDQRSFTLHLKFGSRKSVLPKKELSKLTELLHSLDGLIIRELIVEGHTNNIPIAKRNRHEFANNMELSKARAAFVAAYLREQLQLDEHIVLSVGKGEIEPVMSNKTRKGRTYNRRVVLKVRADKISHDFSSALKGKHAQATGKAEASWDDEEEDIIVSALPIKDEGILSPATGMNLPFEIAAVRIALDSRLKAILELDGKVIGDDRIGFKAEDSETGKTTYTYIGIDFGKPGKHTLQLRGLDDFGNARFDETVDVVRTGAIARIKLLESDNNIADGKTPVRLRLAITDQMGKLIHGSIELMQMGGDLSVLQSVEIPLLANEAAQVVTVAADGWVTLAPVSATGTHSIVLGHNGIQENIEVYVKPDMREDWIMIGFGEGTLGYNNLAGAIQPITTADEQDKFYKDGQISFYAKGQVPGGFLLTIAYDTRNIPLDERNSRFGDIDPNVMYTVYGDTTQQQFDAASSEKLYVKVERDTFYTLFGDYNTGLSSTEFTRYSRTFTGLKTEIHEDALGMVAFATQTSQTMVHDDIQGNGTSGLYRLSRQNIITNSESIRIETVDRFRSEVILNTVELTRHLDYEIDYVSGTIWFKQPVLSKDLSLNPMMIRAEYESDDLTDSFTTAGGRIYVKPSEQLEVGGSFISEGSLAGSNTLSGFDIKAQVTEEIELVAEVAESVHDLITAQAWKLEANMTSEALTGQAYARQQDDNFGLGQQLGSENSTMKVGVDSQYRLDEYANINTSAFRQETINTGAIRDMASVQYNKHIDDYDWRVGLLSNRDVDGAGTITGSEVASVGASSQVTDRWSVRADHEEALSQSNGIDFPSRSTLGSDYQITSNISLGVTQEWTRGQTQDTSSTRIGVNVTPWNGAQISTSYEQQLGEDGKRSLANTGLLQTWEISDTFNLSASLDQTKVLTKATPVQLNLNAVPATGGEDFTAYSVGSNYRPGDWTLTNRLEYRTSDISLHHGASMGIQGSPLDALSTQFTMLWQKDVIEATSAMTLLSDASLRVAWRPSYDKLMLLNRFDIRRNEATGIDVETRSQRYINNMTANWQTTAEWQLLFNHGIKFSDEIIGTTAWTGVSDLIGLALIYDFNEDWDLTMQASSLRVRHLNQTDPSAGLALGYNMFDNFWLSFGYNFFGFYDEDFTASEYTREGGYMRFRFKFDQHNLEDVFKTH